jgi:hypothetical protein
MPEVPDDPKRTNQTQYVFVFFALSGSSGMPQA